ncbi:Nucleoside-diphosphate-sugar epimerase [Clostridium cavendishii DSM 21758]|uniref:UDP-glucose 4-epimerase n=1 Tax=Clostridium cavendishii DSM 21758 TaxID=1121302 RepID=A0A1M6NGZ8_9CLOT|nr:NAD-dependent epimerase/dehydratase family protein [Clostridium cavendishii]SHJ94957.1 Nucleoside-diphosphate-sugar epimerase [Clostridium cavendishii DSM 21758]
MDVLVFGGTRFFGKVLVNKLIDMGHNVTIATRGLTRDTYEDRVSRITLDRENKESIELGLKNKKFDIIYDNLCYSSNSAKTLCDIIKDKTKKYIVVSSSAVYNFDTYIKEEDFNPDNYEIIYGERKDFSYAEGKRLVEAVIFQNYNIPTIAVRFPVVLAEDDYTKRLYSYVESVMKEDSLNIDNMKCDLSFISSKEAGEFLAFLVDMKYTGAVNAASEGSITLNEIIAYIEEAAGKKANIKVDGETGAYNGMFDCSLDISRAKELGFEFNEIRTYIFNLIDKYKQSITV